MLKPFLQPCVLLKLNYRDERYKSQVFTSCTLHFNILTLKCQLNCSFAHFWLVSANNLTFYGDTKFHGWSNLYQRVQFGAEMPRSGCQHWLTGTCLQNLYQNLVFLINPRLFSNFPSWSCSWNWCPPIWPYEETDLQILYSTLTRNNAVVDCIINRVCQINEVQNGMSVYY